MSRLFLHRAASPLGGMLAVSDEAGALLAVEWEDHRARLDRLLARNAPEHVLEPSLAGHPVAAALRRYFDGELGAIEGLVVAGFGTRFQRLVWAALRRMPPGTTTTYGALAAALGTTAVRAVGAANAANPVSVVVPCHRVLGADGALRGYGGGLARKAWLLDHERRHGNRAAAPGVA